MQKLSQIAFLALFISFGLEASWGYLAQVAVSDDNATPFLQSVISTYFAWSSVNLLLGLVCLYLIFSKRETATAKTKKDIKFNEAV